MSRFRILVISPVRLVAFFVFLLVGAGVCRAADEVEADGKVSFHQDVKPIFQARCQGCHQPAKTKGGYVMTEFESLLKGGDTDVAIVPGQADASFLMELITPVDGEAEMPRGEDPLALEEQDLIRRWIDEGAIDDTPANAKKAYSMENPPVYTRPPVVTALDFSSDGRFLAVSGFHEVLLHHADGSGLAARLIGLAERIQSVAFSPDGRFLAVAGGQPGRVGEVQIWDVERQQLNVSVPVSYDTLYGVSWSPDGLMVAFGAPDNALRAIDAVTGKEVLYQGSHEGWVFDTVFSVDGSHIVSVGRDMTAKLTEVATQRFVDNITSITPGALKGGIASVDRHPLRDEILVGGSDGIPKIYQMHRTTKREIGDDANLLQELPPLEGRLFSVAYSADATKIAAGSSLDGEGAVHLYGIDPETTVPEDIKAILVKPTHTRSGEETEKLQAYFKEQVRVIAELTMDCGIYAVAFSADGRRVAAAGGDGVVRLIDSYQGEIVKEFVPVQVMKHREGEVASLDVSPSEVVLTQPFDYAQFTVTATDHAGESTDVTRMVSFEIDEAIGEISEKGLLRAKGDGETVLKIRYAGEEVEVPVHATGFSGKFVPDYLQHVTPVISKLGCNAGTCHGAQDGKNGFKLSLRGYDPIYDIRSFTDDMAARRVNVAVPDSSLMLLKGTATVPHEGGQLMEVESEAYQIIRDWIAEGAEVDLTSPRVESIELLPNNPVVGTIGEEQQMRVVAVYTDGTKRDVSAESFIDSGNTEIATASDDGIVTSLRRGEAPILARYEGAYDSTIVTVMGDRSGFVWEEPAKYHPIDEFVAAKLKRMKTLSSGPCTDTEFIRRIYLDLTGLPPSVQEVEAFLADSADSRTKRNALIDRLLSSESFVDHWTNKWADLLQVNRKFLAPEGAANFRSWIRKEVATNTPYDDFVRKILTASGSNRENPPASYYKILRTPEATMENTTHLFLGVRFNCNKCHDHPFERWTQDNYYEMAAFFGQVDLEKDPESGDRQIGATAVESGKPLYEIVLDRKEGEVIHERTREVAPPEFPYGEDEEPEEATRRERLAEWMVDPENEYFASSYVNRVWGYLTGTGLIEPLDDIRAGNPPSNPELLDYLTKEFVDSGMDVRRLIRAICQSHTYQLSIETNEWNEDDTINYSHAKARRLPAEVLYDTIYATTGATSKIPGVKPGMRAAELPDVGVELTDGFLGNLGRPARESSCECERSSDLQLGPIMALVSGPTLGDALSDPENAIADLVEREADDRKVIEGLFMRILNRPAKEEEVEASLEMMRGIEGEHKALVAALEAYEKELAPITAQKEAEREQAIEKAKQELAAYEKELAPKLEELDRQQADRTAQLEAELAAFEAAFPDKLAARESDGELATNWQIAKPGQLSATNGAELTLEDDGSIFVSGAEGKGAYKLTIETTLPNITGVMLEALSDERLPSKGPGRAEDGNFVLTELDLAVQAKGEEGDPVPAKFASAKADFSQDVYSVATAIDGKRDENSNGWAISPEMGKDHVAVFELEQPIGSAAGSTLILTLDQQFSSTKHALGRFRIWLTTSAAPLEFAFPDEIATLLAISPEERDKEQAATLIAYFKERDPEYQQHVAAVEESRKPRPIDPKLKELQDALAKVEEPLPIDPKLAQLRHDAELSAAQLKEERLIGAQDLAWALINSPAFLFNH